MIASAFGKLLLGPRIFSPPWHCALGLVLGFYPSFLPFLLVALAATSAAGLGNALLAHAPALGMRLRGILLLATALGTGMGLALRVDEAARPRIPKSATSLSARLAADSSRAKGGFTLYPLAVEEVVVEAGGMRVRTSVKGGLRLLVRAGPPLGAGDTIAAGGLRFAQGRADMAFGERSSLVVHPSRSAMGRLRAILRKAFHGALERAGGGAASSGLLVALLEGSRDELDAEEGEAFKKAGCAAVLSLSGQHLSILAAALSLVLKPLGGPRKAMAASLIVILVFVLVAGFQPALVRSILMFALAALALFCDRPQETRTILGLSFALQLLIDPESARTLSFCLSYLALFGLVVLAPRFEGLFLPVLPPLLAKAAAASCAAQAATLPLAAAAFGAVYPVGLVASIASAPLVAAFIWWGLAGAIACGLLPAATVLVGPLSSLLHSALAMTMDFFAKAPPLAVSGQGTWLVGGGVVLASAFVYALPYVEHAYGLSVSSPGKRVRRSRRAKTRSRPQL